jgi:hypothetical protein
MKGVAFMFLGVGLAALFVTANYRCGFLPVLGGRPEGAMIVGALALVVGFLSSLLAALFASIGLRRNKGSKVLGILLWASGLLLLSFLLFLSV